MAYCFLNNVYCCYLPTHTSYGLQPLDNGPFNVLKATYRKELEKFNSLTDSAPVDKVQFIRAYSKAREAGLTSKNIKSGFRVTGNWPISRAKALRHPEIQEDKKEATPEPPEFDVEEGTPTTSRQVRDMAKDRSPRTRRLFNRLSKGYESLETLLSTKDARITALEEEVARLTRGKKRKAIPNPNRRFIQISEALAAGEEIPPIQEEPAQRRAQEVVADEVVVVAETLVVADSSVEEEPPQIRTRSGRAVKRRRLD